MPICNNYLYEIAQTEKNKRLTLVTNQLNTDKVLNVIVQQSINHGAICRQDSGNAYCLAIDLRSKQLSEVTISSSEYQQVLRNLNAQADESKAQAKAKADERTARAQANKEALEILNKAESKRK